MSTSSVEGILSGCFARQRTPGVVAVYLFGSVAAGVAHRESDVDVGVLLDWSAYPNPRARFEQRLSLIGVIGRCLRRNDVDVVILNDAPPQLGRHIVHSGKRVFCGSLEAERDFVRDVQLRAADLEPFLRRTRRITLAALAR